MGLWDDFTAWWESVAGHQGQVQSAIQTMPAFIKIESLDIFYNNLDESVRNDPAVKGLYERQKELYKDQHVNIDDPLTGFIKGAVQGVMSLPANDSPAVKGMEAALSGWIEEMKVAGDMTPEQAKTKLSAITIKMLEIFTASAAIDAAAGLVLTSDEGTVSSANTKYLIRSLGFGAVLAAVLHDPVKVGLLRPYNRALEAAFQNRSLELDEILNAYRQRSLSTIPLPNIDDITDDVMDKIEDDNNKNMLDDLAKHGFNEDKFKILSDASTRALTFGNLTAMARMGHYNRQEAIFSLWTFGMDRRIMKSSLAALETMRDVGLWKGFRSMVEPGYVQGLIEEADVREYWTKILVPQQVQDWAMVRLTKSREKYLAKEDKQLAAVTKDLTKADWTTAFINGNIDEATYRTKLTNLGYDSAEVDVLVANAKDRTKTGTTKECKKLSLSDYELAYRNGIITKDQVLARMQGEYCQADIDLEGELLTIDDLSTEAPAKERDLTASTVTTAYVESVMTRDKTIEYLNKLGYDSSEITILMDMADIKKETYEAKKERDEALAEAKRVKEELAAARGGYKKLPLGDYEKAYKYGSMTMQEVLDRMVGEYSPEDIEVERQLLTIGKA